MIKKRSGARVDSPLDVSGHLVAQGLPSAGAHEHKHVLARQRRRDNFLLVGVEGGELEDGR